MGMAQETKHWREAIELNPSQTKTSAILWALLQAFPIVTVWKLVFKYTSCIYFCSSQIAIQMTLLGWLFIADILDNPYGFNVDYDKNLEEVSIYKHSYISNK